MFVSCVDIEGWYGSEGPAYNCEWYASSAVGGAGDANCRLHGSDPYKTNFNRTAAEACCACGGGIREMKATTTFNQHHSSFPLITSDRVEVEVEDRRTAADVSNSNTAGTIGRATANSTRDDICSVKFRPCLSLNSCGSGHQQFSSRGLLPSPTCWNLIIWQLVLALVLMNVNTLATVLVKMKGWVLSARRGRTDSSSCSSSTHHVANKTHKKKEDGPHGVESLENNPRCEEQTIKIQHQNESTSSNHVMFEMDSINNLSVRTAELLGLRPVSRQINRSQGRGGASVISYASSSAAASLESFPFSERSPSSSAAAAAEDTSVGSLDGKDLELNIATASVDKNEDQQAPQDETRKDSLATLTADAKKREVSPIFQTFRSEANFRKRNDDPTIKYPCLNGTEYVTMYQGEGSISTFTVLKTMYLRKNTMESTARNTLFPCIGVALLSSTFAALLVKGSSFERIMSKQECPDRSQTLFLENFIQKLQPLVRETINGYKFLPLFLLIGYIAFLVGRWRKFMECTHNIQGRIHNIGLLCGGLPTPTTSMKTSVQKKMYRVYRLINVLHMIHYRSFSPSLQTVELEDFVTTLNLLEVDEAIAVGLFEGKAREALLATIQVAIKDLAEEVDDKFAESIHRQIPRSLCELRGYCAMMHDLFVRDNPNEYIASLGLLVWIYGALVAIGFPIILHSSSETSNCIQPAVFLAVFIVVFSLSFPSLLFKTLQNPFADDTGINVDNLMASSELTLFQTMRIQWSNPVKNMNMNLNSSNNFRQSMDLAREKSRRRLGQTFRGGFGEL